MRKLKAPPGSFATSDGGIRHARKFGPTLHEHPSSPKANRRRADAIERNATIRATLTRWGA